jgi:hypothetical protein
MTRRVSNYSPRRRWSSKRSLISGAQRRRPQTGMPIGGAFFDISKSPCQQIETVRRNQKRYV